MAVPGMPGSQETKLGRQEFVGFFFVCLFFLFFVCFLIDNNGCIILNSPITDTP